MQILFPASCVIVGYLDLIRGHLPWDQDLGAKCDVICQFLSKFTGG